MFMDDKEESKKVAIVREEARGRSCTPFSK